MDAVVSRSSKTPLLDRVKTPDDLRKLAEADLPQLAAELRTETIDAVSVTVPNFLHREIGCAVLEAGKHLWIEKPVGLSAADATAVAEAAAAHHLRTAAGMFEHQRVDLGLGDRGAEALLAGLEDGLAILDQQLLQQNAVALLQGDGVVVDDRPRKWLA